VNTQQQIGVETVAKCKGLTFKHVPQKGGSNSNTQLMGGHIDFIAGSGSHLPFVEQGEFRELLVLHRDTRDPTKPNVPIMKDIGCPPSNPALGMIVVAPAGLPADIAKKLEQTMTTVVQQASFQELLKRFNLPYDFKDSAQLKQSLAKETEWYKQYLTENNLLLK
jgi:tripartite-type tricarboxylate transporter receptor subunit TctC